ncbi:hypothetical protein LBMAG13_13430 [Actinomycetes bacterium]|nr:hypothetical protein LBMAG13_13380 [Actinomycetes bacterium]GDX28918.1 hypothetical protein LBMAG13_13430 [Actinomycetes bacterium]
MSQLIGVYDADATLWGEISYWVGARLGVRHCINGNYPAVVIRDSSGEVSLLMSASEIKACEKSPERFVAKIVRHLAL